MKLFALARLGLGLGLRLGLELGLGLGVSTMLSSSFLMPVDAKPGSSARVSEVD